MIVDCHTHVWASPDQLGRFLETVRQHGRGRRELTASPAGHALAAECVHKTLILGFRSAFLAADVPNEFIAEYVARQGDRMIGIAAVDPTERGAVRQAEALLERREFRGLTISPAAQNFHPADSRAMPLYEMAQDRGAPILFQLGPRFPASGRMEYARPVLLDEIAREFPRLTIVISALGMPWVEEGVALLDKHPRIFADISGLIHRPWRMYNAMILAGESNVLEKVFFASDFPFLTAAEAIEALYRINEVTQGTNLPAVPREKLRLMVECDALSALGIARPEEIQRTQDVRMEPPSDP